jgi:hypothetical protein
MVYAMVLAVPLLLQDYQDISLLNCAGQSLAILLGAFIFVSLMDS